MTGTEGMWIPAAISAAGGIVAGGMAAKGAKDAANTQVAAQADVLKLLDKQQQQVRADLAPYRAVGGQAMTTLGAVMGLPGGSAGGAEAGGASLGTPLNSGLRAADIRRVPGDPRAGYVPATAGAKWIPPDDVGGLLDDAGRPITRPPWAEQQSASAYTVTMRAPDGTTQAVPASQVAHYQARGAQVVRS